MSGEHKQHSVTIPFKLFWTILLGACVLAGVLLGVLTYESRKVVQVTNEILMKQEQYEQLQEQYGQLAIQNQELTDKVQVLSDTINKRTMEDEAAAKEEAQVRIPTGFPVTGSVTEAEAPEEDNPLELCVYYEASVDSVVAATARGQVLSTRKNAYDKYEIQVDHGNGYISVYTNEGYPMVQEGFEVLKGTPLFYVGEDNTLVQYQITKDGALIDVYTVMGIDG